MNGQTGTFLSVWHDHAYRGLQVIVYRILPDGAKQVAKIGPVEWVDWPVGEFANSTLHLPTEMATDFLHQAREAIQGTGIKILEDNEAIMRARAAEAELKAVRDHLEDIRSFSNLRDKPGPLK